MRTRRGVQHPRINLASRLFGFLCTMQFIAAGLLLMACANSGADSVDRIVLKVYRGALLNLFDPQHTYVIAGNGSGEVDEKLPLEIGDEPRWSADGKWITFSTLHTEGGRAGAHSGIYLMRSDGSQRMRLTDLLHDNKSPTWSPDG